MESFKSVRPTLCHSALLTAISIPGTLLVERLSLPHPQAFTPEFLLMWSLSTEYIFHLEHSAGANGNEQPVRLEKARTLGPPGNTGRRLPRDRGWTQEWASDLPTPMGSAKQQPNVGLLIQEVGARDLQAPRAPYREGCLGPESPPPGGRCTGDLQRDLQALSSILGGLSCDLHSTCHHFWAVAALGSWGGDIPGRVPSERGSLHPFKDSGRFKAQGDHQGRDCDPTTSFLMTSRKGTPPISPTVLSMRRLLLGVLTWTDVK